MASLQINGTRVTHMRHCPWPSQRGRSLKAQDLATPSMGERQIQYIDFDVIVCYILTAMAHLITGFNFPHVNLGPIQQNHRCPRIFFSLNPASILNFSDLIFSLI